MMTELLLPTVVSGPAIEQVTISEQLILGTSTGLVKDFNEDRIGYRRLDGVSRLVVTDGHWGDLASDVAAKFWLQVETFPRAKAEACDMVEELETELCRTILTPGIDPGRQRTPETGFLAAEIKAGQLCLAAFGDCRLLVVRDGAVAYEAPTQASWLGALSWLGHRPSANQLTQYDEVNLQPNDTVLLFSDGIDECVYGMPTIEPDMMVAVVNEERAPKAIFTELMKQVFAYGAEDNASLAVLQA